MIGVNLKNMKVAKSGDTRMIILPKEFFTHGVLNDKLRYDVELLPVEKKGE